MLSLKQGSELVNLARKAIETALEGKKLDSPLIKKYNDNCGVFVTLHLYPSNDLRGCVGFVEPVLPLGKAVIEAAKSAAFSDPRFMPLQDGELDNLIIEVSILTKPQEVEKTDKNLVKEIEIGKDGLIVSSDGFSGLLLPQVAVEQKWNQQEFLEHTCLKAGLEKDAWMKRNCKIYKFQAQIFSEIEPKGEVVEK
jgi:hypothetical protein